MWREWQAIIFFIEVGEPWWPLWMWGESLSKSKIMTLLWAVQGYTSTFSLTHFTSTQLQISSLTCSTNWILLLYPSVGNQEQDWALYSLPSETPLNQAIWSLTKFNIFPLAATVCSCCHAFLVVKNKRGESTAIQIKVTDLASCS